MNQTKKYIYKMNLQLIKQIGLFNFSKFFTLDLELVNVADFASA